MSHAPRRAFTLVEILVVIAVILLLVGLIVAGAGHIFSQQKARNTQAMMQALTAATEQFRETNPLRTLYDVRDQGTFGALPPYQLRLPNVSGNPNARFAYAPYAMEPDPPIFGNPSPDRNPFGHRIARDLGCRTAGDLDSYWEGPSDDENTDIRALYAYLKVFLPGSLTSVPEANIRKIPHAVNRTADFHANPKGPAAPSGNHATHVDVLGFVDGWGVPLDYGIMANFKWSIVRERDSSGSYSRRYRVTDRQIMLRSRGMELEKYNAWVATNPASPDDRAPNLISPASSIFSAELPKPWASLKTDSFYSPPGPSLLIYRGDFRIAPEFDIDPSVSSANDGPGNQGNGWLRVVGKLDEYNYRPN